MPSQHRHGGPDAHDVVRPRCRHAPALVIRPMAEACPTRHALRSACLVRAGETESAAVPLVQPLAQAIRSLPQKQMLRLCRANDAHDGAMALAAAPPMQSPAQAIRSLPQKQVLRLCRANDAHDDATALALVLLAQQAIRSRHPEFRVRRQLSCAAWSCAVGDEVLGPRAGLPAGGLEPSRQTSPVGVIAFTVRSVAPLPEPRRARIPS